MNNRILLDEALKGGGLVVNMRRFAVTLAALFLAFSIAIDAVDAAGTNSDSAGTTKADTNHKIGDRYTYRVVDLFSKVEDRQYTMIVTGIKDGQVIFGNGGRITDLLGNDIKLGKGVQISGQQIFVPEYGIGKTWTTKYQERKRNGAEFMITYEFKVVSRELISVPAGTFDTYRVEGEGYIHKVGGRRKSVCAERHSIFKIWIAPDKVRQYIAQDYIEEGAAVHCRIQVATRTELVSYRSGEQRDGANLPDTAGSQNFVPGSKTVE
jgi:hypothetical protein